MAVSRLRWWPARRLAAVAERLEAAVAGWCEAWGCPAPASVECVREHEWGEPAGVRIPWQALAADATNGRRALLAAAPALRASIFAALFGPRPVSAGGEELAADQLAERAWNELQQRLRAACMLPESASGTDDAEPARQRRAWSGAVVATVHCGAMRIVLHLDAACVAAIVAGQPEQPPRTATPPLASLAEALHARAVRVRATVAAGDLDLGSLQALSIGDVIRLPHPLDRPLAVQAEDDPLPCGAYLGQRDGRRAIELAHRAMHTQYGDAPS